jgi:hypothetical protein
MASFDKRRSERHLVVCPVYLDTATRKERLGITRNVSLLGTLVLTNSHFAVGDQLEVTFYVSGDKGSPVSGRVVRIEELGPEVQWRFALGVRFERPLPDADAVFAESEDR